MCIKPKEPWEKAYSEESTYIRHLYGTIFLSLGNCYCGIKRAKTLRTCEKRLFLLENMPSIEIKYVWIILVIPQIYFSKNISINLFFTSDKAIDAGFDPFP